MADSKTTIGNQKAVVLDKTTAREATAEEREETLQERENALAAREARMLAMEARMSAAMDRLERASAGTPSEEDLANEPKVEYDEHGKEIPRLDLDMPYGTVIGDADAGYVQNGHRFSKDRRYLCEEPKGVGKPFNIKMLGLVKAVAKAA
jgi:hypothetical protein